METFNNIFKPEVKEAAKADREVNKEAEDCMSKARICFALKQFAEYREQYVKAEAKMVAAMDKLTEAYLSGLFDLTTYGAKMLVYMTRLKDLRILLDVVNSDIRKGEKNG